MTLLESNDRLCAGIEFACVCSCQNHVTLLEFNERLCVGIEFACVFMLKSCDSA